MTILDAIVLGLVEGITEYLPISSTGHLILAQSLLGLNEPRDVERAVDTFNIVVQGGAILAVLGLYRQSVLDMTMGLLGRNPKGLRLAIRIIVAFLPAAILGVQLNDWLEAEFFNAPSVLTALFLGGLWMIWLDRWRKKRPDDAADRTIDDITIPQALGIGLFQCVAMIPGTSRSMMTIAGGTLLGLKPVEAAKFSFLLGLPTLGGACVYSLYSDLSDAADDASIQPFHEVLGLTPILVGLIVATVSAAFAVRWLVNFLNKHGLAPFGYYRIALAIVMGGMLWAGIVSL